MRKADVTVVRIISIISMIIAGLILWYALTEDRIRFKGIHFDRFEDPIGFWGLLLTLEGVFIYFSYSLNTGLQPKKNSSDE